MTKVVEDRGRVLGATAPETFCARHELADALLELGRWDEAEREYQAALAGHKPQQYCILRCRFGRARVMTGRGRLDEATAQHEEVLSTMVEILGGDHPRTLCNRFELAALLALRGRTTEAITAHRAVLDSRSRVLGIDHPDTARSRTALAEAERTREE